MTVELMAHQREGIDFLTIGKLACSLSNKALGKPWSRLMRFEGSVRRGRLRSC